MDLTAFDNETFLIEPGQLAPRLVCSSFSDDGERAELVHVRDPACERLAWDLLLSNEQLGGQNVSYDLATWCVQWPDMLEVVFATYDQDRIVDSMIRQKLLDIAHGVYRGYRNGMTGLWVEYKYSLADLAKRHEYPHALDKDTWRLRYSELIDTPVDEWEEGAREYSLYDAKSTWWVINKQEQGAQFLVDQYRQGRAAWALHLMSAWGLRTDARMVAKLEWLTRAMLQDHEATLLEAGLLVPKKAGGFTKKNKLAQQHAERVWASRDDGEIPANCLTASGMCSLSEDAATTMNDPLVTAFQQWSSAATIIARVEELRAGVDMPIHTRFDELMVSGRTSSSKPNVQARTTSVMVRPRCEHWPANAKKTRCPECSKPYHMAGDRESFVPREGHVFLVSDVPGLELRTIGQTCLKIVGHSRLAEALNARRDPHVEVGATLLGISSVEAYERKKNIDSDYELYLARQTGKVVNFGLNARLGWRGLIEQARTKYDIVLDERQSKDATEAYYATWPEAREFHDWIDANCGQTRSMHVVHLFSEREQGLVPPTVASNTYSQGLGADATKAALYQLTRACYVQPESVLYGSRPVNYIHDEYVTETLEENLDEKAREYARLICTEANKWLPDVPIPEDEMQPLACRRWSKKARLVKNADGTLGAWEWQEWLEQEKNA